ncbi:restriction endonuclease subunit S [Paraburkholderia silvatlantica]|uniref:Type I restriction enzyme S subunit n=1 Tax=Paraburkholderia silvatlantica TaxID=321895 RepID=A0ABR6FI59_9BURK|nr:restriction endonuclease subunit S [Paraburkholderia silvatlantica]MBB2927106.1 type I restriction enzyme S subunit [Paraburkholderia silvatlantica]PVY36827.1 type I restriction enzyme S subunit [Paraburkholderia silvatlantica]PXW41895.1 type I restriction enzyme S subunit [Paraburkholderia silvatlantica]
MSLVRYSSYKDSGLPWLGEIPKHWRVGPLKYFVRRRSGAIKTGPFGSHLTSAEMMQGTIKVYNQRNVIDNDFSAGDNFVTEAKFEQLRAFEAFPGDVLVTTRGTIGRAAILPEDAGTGVLHPCLLRVQPDAAELDVKFLCALIQDSNLLRTQIELYSNATTIEVIYSETMASLVIPVPPLEEQLQILSFLDHETGKIDALIAEQEKLLTLMAEKRQATISHAVTRGVNPDVPLKASGVAWLGEVPAHWRLSPLKRAVVLQRGHDLPSEERVEGDIPVVSSGGVSGRHNKAATSGPTIVTGRYGTIGEFTLVDEDCWPLNTALYAIEMYDNLPRYLWYMLQSLKHLFILNSLKTAVPGVDKNDIHPTIVCVPPVSEQAAIVAFLDAEIAKLDALKAEAERAIDLLKERRSALISAAVTGKIDVRNAMSQELAA